MEVDFSGYATKTGLKCADGRTITPNAFEGMGGQQVPLVWQHGHNDPANVLGHVKLEHRSDGTYAYGYFNDTPSGLNAKALVKNGDINQLSIYANQLVEKAKQVLHGKIREVSLVLAGANPGAKIDYVRLQHSDDPEDFTELDDEAVIHTDDETVIQAGKEEDVEALSHAGQTGQEVYDSMSEDQKDLVSHMIDVALKSKAVQHSDTDQTEKKATEDDDKKENEEGDLSHTEGSGGMTRNVFEQNAGQKAEGHTLTHDAVKGIFAEAVKTGSLKAAIEDYALQHGITNIDVLFPEARTESSQPEFDKRRTEWVAGVINGVRKSPFTRVKTLWADLTMEEARAKGYIKGELKKEEWFGVSKRVTTPTTVYKKQKLDRDDILDITDFDVVAWLKGEMRLMLEEELARAILIGDGRDIADEDKILDPAGASSGAGIRSIANDHELYTAEVNVPLTNETAAEWYGLVEAVLRARRLYKGTGTPTFYTTEHVLTELLLLKDGFDRRRFQTVADLANELRVDSIVTLEVMEEDAYSDLIGLMVNLSDYRLGADKGGETTFFDFFDIDYNQYKYLYETRLSGALAKLRAAVKFTKVSSSDVNITPTVPTFNETTGVVTIPTQTGTVYKNADTNATLTAGAQSALAPGASLHVRAVAAAGYYYDNNIDDEWTFTRPE